MRREGSPPWPQGNLLSRSAGRYSAAPGPAKAPGLNAGPQMGSSRDDFYSGQNRDPTARALRYTVNSGACRGVKHKHSGHQVPQVQVRCRTVCPKPQRSKPRPTLKHSERPWALNQDRPGFDSQRQALTETCCPSLLSYDFSICGIPETIPPSLTIEQMRSGHTPTHARARARTHAPTGRSGRGAWASTTSQN